MSEIDQLINIIQGVLQGNDDTVRKNAEAALVQLRESKPNQLIMAFMMIVQGQYKKQHRTFAASQVRLSLSIFSPASYKNIWKSLTPQNQNNVKNQLFHNLFNQQDLTMKKQIANTLGEIAGSILAGDKENQNSWPEFKPHLWELFKHQNPNSILAGFYVLQTFLPLCPQTFDNHAADLYALFKNGLSNQSGKMKLSALNAFSSYLEVLETKQHKHFKSLIEDIYNAVYFLLLNESEEEGLETLSEMLQVEVKFFKNSFKQLNILLQNIFNIPNIVGGVKRMATEIMVDFAEKSPAFFRKNKQYIQNVLDMVFIHMIDIESQITDQWKKPPEGYNDKMEDEDDFETTRFGMGAIDRIIYAVGDKQVLPILSETIKNLLTREDWRYQYTAVMALSQIGQYIEDPNHISSIIQMITNYLSHDNPMIRYSACHAIGQISDDMQPKFQEIYGAVIYPKLISLLQDPIPRVISHSAAALTNFLEGMKLQKIASTLDQLMQLLVGHSKNGISLVKESCLSTISSVAQISKENFERYLEISVAMLFEIVETHTSKEYKQVRGQAIETLTMIASSVGAQKFRPALQRLVTIMITIQQSNFEQTDPQKSYILAGWQRLCLVYGQQLSVYLPKILPSLFALVQNVINNELNLVNNPQPKADQKQDDKDGDENINTFQTEEAEIAIGMLNVFIQQLKQLYGPYVQDTATLLCKIITDHLNQDVKEAACLCLPNLVKAVKGVDQNGAISMTKYFMDTLVKTIEGDSTSDTAIVEIQTLKSVLQDLDLAFLNQQELSQFSEKVLNMLKQCEQIKRITHQTLNQGQENELDEDDKAAIDDGIKMQQEKQVAISELMGILFKTHKDMAMPLAQYIINNIFVNTLKPGLSENMYKFSIFLIDDMIQYLGYSRLESHWAEFGKVLIGFCKQKSCELRQAACYGLGIFAENTPSNVTNADTVNNWLQNLVESSKVPKGDEKQKTYGHCRDNAIAAIGKTLKVHASHVNAYQYLAYWLSNLPLKFDKPQAIVQHEFLVDILINKAELILGQNSDDQITNLVKVLNVIGAVINFHKICNENIKIKAKQFITSLSNVPLFAQKNNQIWNSLGQKQRQNIKNLLNN